jgi:hypothetical protein
VSPYLTYPELGRVGRLGNQLWQIASTVGLAVTHGYEPRFPTDWAYRRFFSIPDEFFCDIDATVSSELATHLDSTARIYLQDYGLVAHVEPVLRRWFAPAESAPVRIGEGCAAICVRRGDHLHQPQNYPLPTERYYHEALSRLPEGDRMVFSDDIDWCEENLDYLGLDGQPDVSFFRSQSPPADVLTLFIMSHCAHHVIANSTFDWWGAFLSDDPSPIYPSVWYGPAMGDCVANWHVSMPGHWREVEC